MDLVAFPTPGLGDQTYLLVHERRGVLVDPQRDIERFLSVAAERDVEVRFVLETHLHNDYLSGAALAAQRTGAELVLPAAAAAAYPHTPAFHLEDLGAGSGLTIRPIHTPGHTPEHTSYLILINGEPVAVFSGGSLLAASVGRPDLLGPTRARTLARLQHESVHRLARLPSDVALLPTHGHGSFCTATSRGEGHTSTIGQERDHNPLLRVEGAEAFADRVLAEPLPIPTYYQRIGPVNILGVPPMPPLTVPELALSDLADDPTDPQLVDIRPRTAQAAGIVPGSLGIELADDFGSWAGWLLSDQTPIVLIAEPGQDVTTAVTQLAQVGLDNVRGVVRSLGEIATVRFELVDLATFRARLSDPAAQVLDVRTPNERAQVRLDGAIERFLPDLVAEGVPAELDPQRPVLVACRSGRRSTIAATVLVAAGYRPVVLNGAGVPDVVATTAV